MRITGVKTYIVDTPIPEEHRVRSGAGYKLARQAAFVELTTDEGLKGYGPCSFGSASLDLGSVATLCDHTFADALVGEDPHRIEHLWDKIYYGSIVRVHGPRSVGVAILSAIDIALWDLKGKALGVPVYQLLGGAFRDPVPAYSSSVYWSTPEHAVEQAQAFLDLGFKAFKVKVGLDVDNDVASLRAIREHVGPGIDILVDANQCYTRHLALKVGRVLEELDVLLFEEPLPIDDVAGHAFLADKLDVRIATGENMYTRWDFLPYFEAGAIHVVQADASRCGGISEAKRIFDLAGAYHLHAIPHTFSDALTIAANLHVVAASSNAPIIEYDATYNPIQTALVTNPPLPRQRDRAADRAGARRRHRLGLRRRPPVHGPDRHRRGLAADVRAEERGHPRPHRNLARLSGLGDGSQLARPGHVGLLEREEREPGAGQVLLEVRAAGICGTDLHIEAGEYACEPPVTMGHEVCGVVAAVGPASIPALVGTRVVSETYYSTCGTCRFCRDGRTEPVPAPALDRLVRRRRVRPAGGRAGARPAPHPGLAARRGGGDDRAAGLRLPVPVRPAGRHRRRSRAGDRPGADRAARGADGARDGRRRARARPAGGRRAAGDGAALGWRPPRARAAPRSTSSSSAPAPPAGPRSAWRPRPAEAATCRSASSASR